MKRSSDGEKAASSQSLASALFGVDLDHGDAGFLERAVKKYCCASRRDEVDDAVDAVRLGLLQVPLSAQPGMPRKSANAANARRAPQRRAAVPG